MAQLAERPLPIPDVRGSTPAIGKNLYIEYLFTVNGIEKTKIKGKEVGNGPFLKTILKAWHYFLATSIPLIIQSPDCVT